MSFIKLVSEDEKFTVKIGDSEIYCRRYSRAAHKKLEKSIRKREVTRQGQKYWDVDDDKMNDLIVDYVITGWKGVPGAAGKDEDCVMENKLRLPGDAIAQIMDETGATSLVDEGKTGNPSKGS